MQDASDILALNIQLTEDVSDYDESTIFEGIQELLFPITEMLQQLPGNLMPAYVKVSGFRCRSVMPVGMVSCLAPCRCWAIFHKQPAQCFDDCRPCIAMVSILLLY